MTREQIDRLRDRLAKSGRVSLTDAERQVVMGIWIALETDRQELSVAVDELGKVAESLRSVRARMRVVDAIAGPTEH